MEVYWIQVLVRIQACTLARIQARHQACTLARIQAVHPTRAIVQAPE